MSSKVYVYSLQGVPFLDPLPRWLSEFLRLPNQNRLHPYTFSEYFHLSFRNFMTAFATASYDLGYVPNLISRWRFDETQLLGFSFFPAVHQIFHQTTPTKKHKPTFFFFGNKRKKQQQNQPLEMKRIHRENLKKQKKTIFRVISMLNLQIRFF